MKRKEWKIILGVVIAGINMAAKLLDLSPLEILEGLNKHYSKNNNLIRLRKHLD